MHSLGIQLKGTFCFLKLKKQIVDRLILVEQFANILHLINLTHLAFGVLSSTDMGQFMFLILDPIHGTSGSICYRVSETLNL
jgi:hypothetical protein